MSENPFTFGAMITNPNQFIGRRAELTQIIGRLEGSQPQGSAVVGPRRIGKSSLLYYLTHPRSDEPLRPPTGQQVIYLSAAAGHCGTPAQFRATLMGSILQHYTTPSGWFRSDPLAEAKKQLAAGEPCSWEMARDILEKLLFHPVICLDEFEALLSNDFDNRFFNGLRNWANEGALSWVTASAKPMEELAELRGLTSPFFNLLATIALGGLAETEVEKLLSLADNTAYPFSNKEKRIIRRLGDTHPYHLQIAADQLRQMKTIGRVNKNAIQHFLCQQPEPPAYCKRFRWHKAWMVVAVLLVVVLLLIGVLAWQAPAFVARVWSAISLTLRAVGDELGWWGDAVGGLVIFIGLWQTVKHRRSIGEFLRKLISG